MKNKIYFLENLLVASILVLSSLIIYSTTVKNNLLKNKQNHAVHLQKNQEEVIDQEEEEEEEEYIPFLDNMKVQISLWFAIQFAFLYICNNNTPAEVFRKHYPFFKDAFRHVINNLHKTYVKDCLVTFFIIIPTLFVIVENIASFFYLIACLINKKPFIKAFSIRHRFWRKSWLNLFFTVIIFNFQFVLNNFLKEIIKYSIGYFSFNKKQKDYIIKEKKLIQILSRRGLQMLNAYNIPYDDPERAQQLYFRLFEDHINRTNDALDALENNAIHHRRDYF